jgi:hypothetical protein
MTQIKKPSKIRIINDTINKISNIYIYLMLGISFLFLIYKIIFYPNNELILSNDEFENLFITTFFVLFAGFFILYWMINNRTKTKLMPLLDLTLISFGLLSNLVRNFKIAILDIFNISYEYNDNEYYRIVLLLTILMFIIYEIHSIIIVDKCKSLKNDIEKSRLFFRSGIILSITYILTNVGWIKNSLIGDFSMDFKVYCTIDYIFAILLLIIIFILYPKKNINYNKIQTIILFTPIIAFMLLFDTYFSVKFLSSSYIIFQFWFLFSFTVTYIFGIIIYTNLKYTKNYIKWFFAIEISIFAILCIKLVDIQNIGVNTKNLLIEYKDLFIVLAAIIPAIILSYNTLKKKSIQQMRKDNQNLIIES